MREIVQIQCGLCGNRLGAAFWDMIANEHGLDMKGAYIGLRECERKRINVFFTEQKGNQYIPRTVLADMDSGSLDFLQSLDSRDLYNPQTCITGRTGTGNCWARGFYGEGATFAQYVLDVVHKQMEECDYPQGFQLVHALSGGTGSGLGTLLMRELHDEYPDVMMSSMSVFPNESVSDIVIEPYNAILAINQLIENVDLVHVYDNDATMNACVKRLGLQRPGYADFNALLAYAMSGVTSTFRFPCIANTDIRKLATNLMPWPGLRFVSDYCGELLPCGVLRYVPVAERLRLRARLFSQHYAMCSASYFSSLRITGAITYRGNITLKEAYDVFDSIFGRAYSWFVPNLSCNIMWTLCDVAPKGLDASDSMMCVMGSFDDYFKKQLTNYRALFQKKAFLRAFIQEGVEEADFEAAAENIQDIIDLYTIASQETYEEQSDSEEDYAEDSFNDPTRCTPPQTMLQGNQC